MYTILQASAVTALMYHRLRSYESAFTALKLFATVASLIGCEIWSAIAQQADDALQFSVGDLLACLCAALLLSCFVQVCTAFYLHKSAALES